MERLQGEVDNLTTDVARLEMRVKSLKEAMPRRLRTFDPECKVVSEYFRVFAHGFRHSFQLDFLHGIMTDAMAFNSHVGLDSLIAQWTLCMSVFQSVMVSWIQSCIVVCHSEVVVDGLAIFYLRLSRHTIEALFPHLLSNEPIVQRLVGQVMELPTQCQFTFDAESVKVKKYCCFACPAVALMNLLHSAEDTAVAIDGTLFGDNAEILPTPRLGAIRGGIV
ncbi:hypothetical protein H310_12318 [Aphanomyces invadans]|uniref:Uncharacterized protein n=1 Tax=Aphanomyces invadans TaxID=157072 RepID=A0A024TK58_9STRA|nr:hypothetical protein H310_12318 [Aphanomyces invadans]ETV93742.1 hypothetical protein H310_12318 [Aphanomyces invadans]RHY27076.1 hypothetical protein DYB32_007070 [Aphanomyces invadans]|eukprot:XP_008877551.1 hypothetical protein H310_12318 [Aphanomyces invadans]